MLLDASAIAEACKSAPAAARCPEKSVRAVQRPRSVVVALRPAQLESVASLWRDPTPIGLVSHGWFSANWRKILDHAPSNR